MDGEHKCPLSVSSCLRCRSLWACSLEVLRCPLEGFATPPEARNPLRKKVLEQAPSTHRSPLLILDLRTHRPQHMLVRLMRVLYNMECIRAN